MTNTQPSLAHLAIDEPLMKGDLFVDDAGTAHDLAAVSIVVTERKGMVRRVDLTRHGNEWWAPLRDL